ncbi:MAG: ABC transporter ATP-binding protein/permease [Actinobacteria bacterium]|nr:ABC transporter ATP-binding protein/permease [Actinomycetota bacterium]
MPHDNIRVESIYDKDEVKKQADIKILLKISKYLKPYKFIFAVTILMLMFTAGLETAGPFILKIAIDKYLIPKNYNGFLYMVVLFGLIILFQFGVRYVQQYMTEYLGEKIMLDLRMNIFSHIHKMEMSFFDRNRVGRLMTRVTTDVQTLNEMLSSGVVALFGDVFIIAAIIAMMLNLDLKLSLVTFSVLILLAAATIIFRNKVRIYFNIIREKISAINSYLQETITGIITVKILNRQKRNDMEFAALNNEYLKEYIKTIFSYAVFFPVVFLIETLAVALIIWYGGGQVIRSILTLGTLVAFIQYIGKFFHPISDLSEKFGILQEAIAASERIFGLLETQPAIVSPANARILTEVKGDIKFKNVWFAYNAENYILKDISFEVSSGESIAFVGATGSGKTSIINILARFYDIDRGNIYLDGIDIREFDLQNLRRHVGVVSQDVFLFSGTIIDNIRLGNKEITLEQVREAARFVNADKFIEKLDGKYFHEVKERGQTLSVGQKQLIAFARAIVFNPKVLLVLDEATSSVDTEIEGLIQDALKKVMHGRTTIIIAHRLSTIRNTDRIIVLSKGKIIESGTHKNLLKNKGIYYKLHKYQYQLQ